MARLLVKTEGVGSKTLELRLGVNRVGRDPKGDFPISHPSVSTCHCELIVSADGVALRDCDSTNGTYVNDQPVCEVWLESGQQVRLGKVELFVESTDVNISIPKIEREIPRPPQMLEDGALLCPRHSEYLATFQCPHCREIMCSRCVTMMRIKGGQPLFLCCVCHQKCERITPVALKKKKGFFGMLQETVRLKFIHPSDRQK